MLKNLVSFVPNKICTGFQIWREFERYLFEEMCDEKNNHFRLFSDHNKNNNNNSHYVRTLLQCLLWLSTVGMVVLSTLYILYRLTRFSEKSFCGSMKTAENIAKNVDLTGKVAIITGATDGLGKETAKVLLKQGACVIIGARNRVKGEETRKWLIDYLSSKNYQSLHTLEKRIILLSIDLSSLQSVRDFVINFNKLGLPLHYLINNGGIMSSDRYELSKDGIEKQFEVNYLSHYYLTRLLTPILLQTPNSRIINLSSMSHNFAPKPFSEWINKHHLSTQGPLKEEYSSQGLTENGISKACMILFTHEYERRYKEIISLSVHPGEVDTKIWNENKWTKRFRYTFLKFLKYFPGDFKSVEQGAATIMYCIVTPNNEIKSGNYYRDCCNAEDHIRNDLLDSKQDMKLWEFSENLIIKSGFNFEL